MITEEALLKKFPELNGFDTVEDVWDAFQPYRYYGEESPLQKVEKPDNIHILFADYQTGDYEGQAYVLGYNTENHKFFEVHGSHCSCYGLEDQWNEEDFDSYEQLVRIVTLRFEELDNRDWLYDKDTNHSQSLREFLEVV